MIDVPHRWRVLVLGLVLATGSASGQPLFQGEAHPRRAAAESIRALVNAPTTASVRIVRADASLVTADTRVIELDLGVRKVEAVQEGNHVTPMGSLVWRGQLRTAARRPNTSREVRRDEANAVVMVRRGDGVTASIRLDGRLYQVQPLPGGDHAVVEIDEVRFPPEHPREFWPLLEQAPPPARLAGVGPRRGAPQIVRVQVAATRAAVEEYGGDMLALAELSVAETNQGYLNSGVGIALELAHYSVVDHAEAGHAADLGHFRARADGRMDEVHAARDRVGADLNVLLVADGSACAMATGVGPAEQHAFATVYYRCSSGYYSFGHVLGHLQGVGHPQARQKSPDSSGAPAQAAFRTVMGYRCGAPCPRLNYWSNPDRTYRGRPLGAADGTNDQRVLEDTKAAVARFRRGGDAGNKPPVARFTSAINGLSATFTDLSDDADGRVVQRRWSFGDGTHSDRTHPTRGYAKPGKYVVELTVTDDEGATHSVARDVEIQDQARNRDRILVEDLEGGESSTQYWTLDVPANARRVTFTLSGGRGDADLYVRFGARPTRNSFDCRPYRDGTEEVCEIQPARAGTWHVMVRGHTAFSGLRLSAATDSGEAPRGYRNDTDFALVDMQAVESPLTVAGHEGRGTRDARVDVALVHTFVGDLVLDLIAPDGSVYNLHNRSDGSADNLGRTYTVDLSEEGINGEWKLRVYDASRGDTGYINHWGVTF